MPGSIANLCVAILFSLTSLFPSIKTPPPPGKTYSIEPSAEFTVVNPASQAELRVKVYIPETQQEEKLPAFILVPGGIADSSAFTKPGDMAEALPAAGFITVVFDADGRGKSGGEENYNGFIQQDGLAEVIRFTSTLPEVDPDKLALISWSYGVTMSTGALSRYPDLPIKFYIDWEGPANRNDTTSGCQNDPTGKNRIPWNSCADDAYWSEREAQSFIGNVKVPYLRVQSEKDHVQPDLSNAIDMINAAVAGNVPWVRLNNEPANQTIDPANPPEMISENEARRQTGMMVKFAIEMAGLFFNP